MLKSTPQKLLAEGTDWRFLNELKNGVENLSVAGTRVPTVRFSPLGFLSRRRPAVIAGCLVLGAPDEIHYGRSHAAAQAQKLSTKSMVHDVLLS